MAKFFSLTWILFLLCNIVKAQVEKIDTDRPDQTESAVTVPKNYFQAEFGFNKENLFYRNYDLVYPTALLKYGLKKFEFRLETTYRSSYEHLIPNPKWTHGFDPLVIGFKAALCEEKGWQPKTSIICSVGLPTVASKSFRADHLAPAFRFTMQHSLTKTIGLAYNIGAEWDGFTKTPAWIYTLATGFNLGDNWYTYLEVFGFIEKDLPSQHNADAGIAYWISDDFKVDISGGFGISESAPKSYAAIGFSFRIKTH